MRGINQTVARPQRKMTLVFILWGENSLEKLLKALNVPYHALREAGDDNLLRKGKWRLE